MLGRSARAWRRGTPWIVTGLVLALFAASALARGVPILEVAPAVGYAHAPATTELLYVNMTDAPAFGPRFLSGAPGTTVTIHLNNTGRFPHTFSMLNQSKVRLATNLTPKALNASFASPPPLVNVSVPAGGTGWANFSLGAATGFDSFEFVSLVPYQFQAGMWGLFNVTSNAPGLELSENTTNALQFQPAVLAACAPSATCSYPVNLDVHVTNLGDIPHTFTVVAQPNVSISSIAYFQTAPPIIDQPVPIPNGTGTPSTWANFTIGAPGVYEYVCTITGHFAAGMYGFLYVGVPVPALPPAPSTAVVDVWVLAGSLVLVGIGGLLVAVAGFTGRFPRNR